MVGLMEKDHKIPDEDMEIVNEDVKEVEHDINDDFKFPTLEFNE